MKIRHATPEDFSTIAVKGRRFHTQTKYQDVPYSEESVCQFFGVMAEQKMLVVGEVDGEIVGFAGGFVAPFFLNNAFKIGQELFYWIDEEHRNGRNGLNLLNALEKAAIDAGCLYWTMIALDGLWPERAEAIYLRAGYTPTERSYTKVLPWPQ